MALDEKAAKTYGQGCCDPRLRKIRNCRGEFEPVSLWINKRLYNQCPVSIFLEHLELKQLVDMYLHSRSRKEQMVDRVDGDVTSWYFEFSKLIEHLIAETQNREMDQMKKDMKKQSKGVKKK